MGQFTLRHKTETVSDMADMLITCSVLHRQDQPFNLPLYPMQARHLGRALKDAVALEQRHADIMASVDAARTANNKTLAASNEALEAARSTLRSSYWLLAGSVIFFCAGFGLWVAA